MSAVVREAVVLEEVVVGHSLEGHIAVAVLAVAGYTAARSASDLGAVMWVVLGVDIDSERIVFAWGEVN